MVNKLEPLPRTGGTQPGNNNDPLNSFTTSPIKGLPITVASLDNDSFKVAKNDEFHHQQILVEGQDINDGEGPPSLNDFRQQLFNKLNGVEQRGHSTSRQSLTGGENRDKGCSRQSSF